VGVAPMVQATNQHVAAPDFFVWQNRHLQFVKLNPFSQKFFKCILRSGYFGLLSENHFLRGFIKPSKPGIANRIKFGCWPSNSDLQIAIGNKVQLHRRGRINFGIKNFFLRTCFFGFHKFAFCNNLDFDTTGGTKQ